MAASAVLLVGCGEKPQALGGKVRASDTKASDGTTQAAYAAPGWKAGDAKSWETQLNVRTQQGQNEYTRTATK
jgi:major membrane immunogen (membrane-anchored lipoprotein)